MKSTIRTMLGALVIGVLMLAIPVNGIVATGQETDVVEWPATGAILFEHTKVYASPGKSGSIGEYASGDIVSIRTFISDQSGNYYIIDFDDTLGYIDVDSVSVLDGEPRAVGVQLKGDQEMTVGLNTIYSDPGYMAYDEYGNDVSADVKIYGTVDTSQLRTYHLTYEYSNYNVNVFDKVRRTVTVVREIDLEKVNQFNETDDTIQSSGEVTFTSNTGMVKVRAWVDKEIVNKKAKINVETTWLGKGEAPVVTRLPNYNNSFSLKFVYEVINNGEYTFSVFEDNVRTLDYSVNVKVFS